MTRAYCPLRGDEHDVMPVSVPFDVDVPGTQTVLTYFPLVGSEQGLHKPAAPAE